MNTVHGMPRLKMGSLDIIENSIVPPEGCNRTKNKWKNSIHWKVNLKKKEFCKLLSKIDKTIQENYVKYVCTVWHSQRSSCISKLITVYKGRKNLGTPFQEVLSFLTENLITFSLFFFKEMVYVSGRSRKHFGPKFQTFFPIFRYWGQLLEKFSWFLPLQIFFWCRYMLSGKLFCMFYRSRGWQQSIRENFDFW